MKRRRDESGREVLRALLAGPLRFTPVIEDRRRGYVFEGRIALGRLIAREAMYQHLVRPQRDSTRAHAAIRWAAWRTCGPHKALLSPGGLDVSACCRLQVDGIDDLRAA